MKLSNWKVAQVGDTFIIKCSESIVFKTGTPNGKNYDVRNGDVFMITRIMNSLKFIKFLNHECTEDSPINNEDFIDNIEYYVSKDCTENINELEQNIKKSKKEIYDLLQ